MNDDKRTSFLSQVFTIGTPACGVFSALAALALALLLLLTGFWNTLWIALMTTAGAVIGGVKDKKQWLKNLLNRLIPDKKTLPYREQHPEIARAVRRATEKAAEAPAAARSEDEQD